MCVSCLRTCAQCLVRKEEWHWKGEISLAVMSYVEKYNIGTADKAVYHIGLFSWLGYVEALVQIVIVLADTTTTNVAGSPPNSAADVWHSRRWSFNTTALLTNPCNASLSYLKAKSQKNTFISNIKLVLKMHGITYLFKFHSTLRLHKGKKR